MSNQKMRGALEQIKALTEIPFAHTAGDHELIYQLAREALAEPSGNFGEFGAPADDQVGLTDVERYMRKRKALHYTRKADSYKESAV